MTKRLFSLIMAIAVMTTMLTAFSLDAYAIGSVYEEDFADTSYDSFKVITSTNKTTATYSNDGGALKIQRTGSNNQLYADFHQFDGKKSVVLEFDFYSDTANPAGTASGKPYISNTMYFTAGQKAFGLTSGHRFYADGVWYRYRFHAVSNGTQFTSVTGTRTNLSTGTSENSSPQLLDKQPNPIRLVVNTPNADFKIDNLRIYDESALIDGNFKIGTTPVTTAAQVTAGNLVATANVGAVLAKSNLEKFMVAFDKDGKMLDCSVTTELQNLTAGTTTAVTATMTLDSEEAAAVADGGYIGFYLWEGMYPEIKAMELK